MNPSSIHIDAIRELCNIGVGRGAAVLNTMLSSHIRLQVPFIKLLSMEEFSRELESFAGECVSAVDMGFKGVFSGSLQLLFSRKTASALVTALVGEEPVDMDIDSLRAGTLCEVGNIVLNGVMGSIANMLKINFTYSVPGYIEETSHNLIRGKLREKDSKILLARTRFTVEELDIDGDIALFLGIEALDKLLEAIDDYTGE